MRPSKHTNPGKENPRGAYPCSRALGKMKCGLCTTAKHACIIVPKSLTQTAKNLQYMARKLHEGKEGVNEAMVINAAKSLSDRMKVKIKEAGKDKPHSLEPVLQSLLHSVRHIGTLYAQAHDLDLPDWESGDEDDQSGWW